MFVEEGKIVCAVNAGSGLIVGAECDIFIGKICQ